MPKDKNDPHSIILSILKSHQEQIEIIMEQLALLKENSDVLGDCVNKLDSRLSVLEDEHAKE